MFYAGAPFVVKGAYAYRNYGYDVRRWHEVEEFLDGYSVADAG